MRKKPAIPTAPDRVCGIDPEFVVRRMRTNVADDVVIRALIAFAEEVGDEGYAEVFRAAAPSSGQAGKP